MRTQYGTCCFRSLADAERYYSEHIYGKGAAKRKLESGEIKLGRPPVKAGDSIHVNDEGRYVVTEGES